MTIVTLFGNVDTLFTIIIIIIIDAVVVILQQKHVWSGKKKIWVPYCSSNEHRM
jgi:hypothetical protein